MIETLVIRFDAPLVSFGGPAVDNYGVVQPAPPLSLLTGLVGNALGLDHRDHHRLQRLQERLRYAVRCDRPGEPLRDFQTVDLGQDFMLAAQVGWTTRERVDERGKSDASEATHIRYRDYRADSVHTVVLTLDPADEEPRLELVEQALREPARPLFIGRKCCLPAAPLLVERRAGESVLQVLLELARLRPERTGVQREELLSAWWPEGDPAESSAAVRGARTVPVFEERDWANQVHSGRRLLRHGVLAPTGGAG